ncbi:Spiroplasmavirus-related protein [Spiroplasma kunkelii CR2-3x]|uniref:Spiroplasmavirus-related protein n=1 Tax=Spiroplasma kunkelii CR2-3x TaxID=273035 RepID=A0A0K2JGJ2_SPIKU|nr:DUF3688 family protein [Spiroplasma kunkelii]ALA97709.1 Spiroplasmavirus-related protein [Spiroplasma kunkelii CR2-3x]
MLLLWSDNRGQLTNFKSIWNIENKVSNSSIGNKYPFAKKYELVNEINQIVTRYSGKIISNIKIFGELLKSELLKISLLIKELICIIASMPGVKQVNELASGVGKVFETVYSFFSQIFEVWKFNPALYSTITNIFLLIIFMKFVRLI